MSEETQFIVHCSYCGYNFGSDISRQDQRCPECGHRASSAEPTEDSHHTLGIKTNYKGEPMDETENRVP